MAPTPNPANPTPVSNQRFALADNMDNIGNIKRMWRAQWPEFSWLTAPGSRCYQMFAPDISRVGYGAPDANNHCPVYAVMCPQQGIWIQPIATTLNIEVTVTSAGGYVIEEGMIIDAQITIQPKIWFSPDTMQTNAFVIALADLFESLKLPFPSSKANAITLNAYGVNQQDAPVPSKVLTITPQMDPNYPVPSYAQHNTPDVYNQVAATCVHLAVEIGTVITSGNELVDWFNQLIIDVFNLASGNLLQNQNVLSWNVWALAPEEVYPPDWQIHADYWRFSLDVNHRSPEGNGRDPKDFEGNPFTPDAAAIRAKLQSLHDKLVSEKLTVTQEVSVQNQFADVEAKLAAFIAPQAGEQVIFL
jgi:hypothetical protein